MEEKRFSSVYSVALREKGELSTDVDNFSLFLGRGRGFYFYFSVLAQHPSATVGINMGVIVSVFWGWGWVGSDEVGFGKSVARGGFKISNLRWIRDYRLAIVTPFQGLILVVGPETQGVALGWLVGAPLVLNFGVGGLIGTANAIRFMAS